MKILYFCNSIGTAGGLDKIVISKANYLAEKHNVYILTTDQKDKKNFYKLDKRVTHIDYSDYRGINNILFSKIKFKKIINEINPDVIISPTGKESFILPFFEKKIPIIKEMHFSREHRMIQATNRGYLWKLVVKIFDFIEVQVFKKYDIVTPLTYEDEKRWPLKNTKVIYNFKTIESKEKALLENKQVMAIGRHDYQKGFDLLLKAWEQVCKINQDWVLNIYGDGILKNDLIQLSYQLKIDKRVIFHGNVKDIKNEYLKNSIYILSSRHEGLPLVLPEAMECGLPIVAFSCPSGPKDIIENESNGLLVENGNITKLAHSIIRLINDENKRKSMGKYAQEKAKEFDKEIIMNEWEDLFNQLIEKGK